MGRVVTKADVACVAYMALAQEFGAERIGVNVLRSDTSKDRRAVRLPLVLYDSADDSALIIAVFDCRVTPSTRETQRSRRMRTLTGADVIELAGIDRARMAPRLARLVQDARSE